MSKSSVSVAHHLLPLEQHRQRARAANRGISTTMDQPSLDDVARPALHEEEERMPVEEDSLAESYRRAAWGSVLWPRVLQYCDGATLSSIVCCSAAVNTLFLQEVMDGVGMPAHGSHEAQTASRVVVSTLTDGLSCREARMYGVEGVPRTVESLLSQRANTVRCRERLALHALRPLGAGGGGLQTTAEEVCRLQQYHWDRYVDVAQEWMSGLRAMRREQFNIRHGLFDSYATKSRSQGVCLPDGTFCALLDSPTELGFYSRGRKTPSCCSCCTDAPPSSARDEARASRAAERRQSRWELEKLYTAPAAVQSIYYDIYSGSLFLNMESSTTEIRISTPRMRAVEKRNHIAQHCEDEFVIKEVERQVPSGIENMLDSMELPGYRWDLREIQSAVNAVEDSIQGKRTPQGSSSPLASDGEEKNPSSSGSRNMEDLNIFVVYDGRDCTESLYPLSTHTRSPFSFTCDINAFHANVVAKLSSLGNTNQSTPLTVPFPLTPNSEMSPIAPVFRHSVSPFSETPSTLEVTDRVSGAEVHTKRSYVFTTFDTFSLILAISSEELHAHTTQPGFPRLCSTHIMRDPKNAKFLSVPPFRLLLVPNAQPVRDCECTRVMDLSTMKDSEVSIEWPKRHNSSNLEMSVALVVVHLGDSYAIMKMKIVRTFLWFAGRNVDTLYSTRIAGRHRVYQHEKWYFTSGYWYSPFENIEVMRTIGCCAAIPRPWTPALLSRVMDAGERQEEEVMARGSNGVEWRPLYDGHPYFKQPFAVHILEESVVISRVCHDDKKVMEATGSPWRTQSIGLVDLLAPHTKENLTSTMRHHWRRYCQLLGSVKCVAVAQANAYIVGSLRDGRVVLLAPLLSAVPEPPLGSPDTADAVTSELQAARETGNSTPATPEREGWCDYVGFGGSRGHPKRQRHYHSTSPPVDSARRAGRSHSIETLVNEDDGEEEDMSVRVSSEEMFGSAFHVDAVLRYIQQRYPSLTDRWAAQVSTAAQPGAGVTLQSYLRLPLYACFLRPLKRQDVDFFEIVAMSVDGWKLTMLHRSLEVEVYDLAALRPTSASSSTGRRACTPHVPILFSLGLFSSPLYSVRPSMCSGFRGYALKLHYRRNSPYSPLIPPTFFWCNGVLVLSTSAKDVENMFLIDFEPEFRIPSVVKRTLKRRKSRAAREMSHSGVLPSSASQSDALSRMGRGCEEDAAAAKAKAKALHETCAALVEAEATGCDTSDDDRPRFDYYLMDLLCLQGEEGTTKTTYSHYIRAGLEEGRRPALLTTLQSSLSCFDTPRVPYFRALYSNVLQHFCEALIVFPTTLLFALYILLNAINISRNTKMMPFWSIYAFALPFVVGSAYLYCITDRRNFYIPLCGRGRDALIFIAHFLLFFCAPILFALKNDGILPSAVKWWHICLTAEASIALLFASSLCKLVSKTKTENFFLSTMFLVLPAIFLILFALFFDGSSPSNPTKGFAPIAVVFIPLFLLGAIFLFFCSTDFIDAGCCIRFLIVVRFIVLFVFLILPMILFVLDYRNYWAWHADPTSMNKPSCVIPAVFLFSDVVIIGLLSISEFIRAVRALCC